MRKNSARKWLHATLDLLPVVIIPIFALYATNKNATFAQEITVNENLVVDFNQHFEYNDFTKNFSYDDDSSRTYNYGGYMWQNHLYIISFEVTNLVNPNNNRFSINVGSDSSFYVDTLTNNGFVQYRALCPSTGNINYMYLINDLNVTLDCSFTFSHYNIIDLTQMFGSGNEPTLQQFNELYPNDYYDYTLSHKELLKDYSQITYNDTDIGSQFIYGLYNSVDKYFNIGNVFNLGSIYDWLLINIFNGNAPIAIYIVWNIVAYEFLMDLLFLLYGLFMFFIDTCSNLMERFYCNLSGRR